MRSSFEVVVCARERRIATERNQEREREVRLRARSEGMR